jgi:diacylglycerol kinase (ATP)
MASLRRHVIVNPASGNGRTGKTWSETARFLQQTLGEAQISFTRAPKDATILTHRALEAGYEHIIAVGGDGTLSEVVNGFLLNDHPVNPNAVLSFVPSGTGSDVSKTLLLPADKKQAIICIAQALSTNAPQMLDVGTLQHKRFDGSTLTGYFLNVASFGMSGDVVRHVNRATFLKRFGGMFAFHAASLLALTGYTNKAVQLCVMNGSKIVFDERIEARLVAVANGRFFGGGMMIAPNAVPNDGLLDIVLVENFNALQIALKLPKIYNGEHLQESNVRVMRGTSVTAQSLEKKRVCIDSDGESPGMLPFEARILPLVLPFVG